MYPPYEYTASKSVEDVYGVKRPHIPGDTVDVAFRPAQKGDYYLSVSRKAVQAQINHPDSEPTIILAHRHAKD